METECEVRGGGVALVRLTRPEARNALNVALRTQLADHFTRLAGDDSVRCVVMAGGEKAFAAGADLTAMVDAGSDAEVLAANQRSWQPVRDFPKPLIAAVRGWALGGGCELAMHADIIVAGEGARFGQPEIRVGIMPGAGGTQRLTRAVGKFKALKMLLTGEPVSAADAAAMGMVSEVVADDRVETRALELAELIAAQPPLAARAIKRTVLAGADRPMGDALDLEYAAFSALFDTQDQEEGMRAFLEKRAPVFKGR